MERNVTRVWEIHSVNGVWYFAGWQYGEPDWAHKTAGLSPKTGRSAMQFARRSDAENVLTYLVLRGAPGIKLDTGRGEGRMELWGLEVAGPYTVESD